MSTELVTWQPPVEKSVRLGIKALTWAVIIGAGVAFVKVVAPTLADVLGLIALVMQNAITMTLSGIVLLGLLILARDIFSKEGRLNQFFKLRYAQLVNWMVWDALNSDPMTPFHEKKKALAKDRVTFTEALASFEGVIRRFLESAEQYRKDAAKAERTAKGADSLGKTELVGVKSHEWGRYNETATDFEAEAQKLMPIRDDLRRVLGVIDSLTQKLDVEIRVTQDKWNASKMMRDLNEKARNIMGFGERYELAQMAAEIVQTKYADEFGRLENLKAIAAPLLDSIDVERGTWSEELRHRWAQADKPMELTATVPMGILPAPTAQDLPLKSLI